MNSSGSNCAFLRSWSFWLFLFFGIIQRRWSLADSFSLLSSEIPFLENFIGRAAGLTDLDRGFFFGPLFGQSCLVLVGKGHLLGVCFADDKIDEHGVALEQAFTLFFFDIWVG